MYDLLPPATPISQGDIIENCPVFAFEEPSAAVDLDADPQRWHSRVIVLTQACDLAQSKATRVVVALVHSAADLVRHGILKDTIIRDHVRRGRVFGWYFLPSSPQGFPESIVDLRDLHTVPRAVLEHLAAAGKRICRLTTPYREHMAQHFAVTYSRIGLPEPYDTEP